MKLIAFGVLTGAGLRPLLEFSTRINPALVPTALSLTASVFVAFSLVSVFLTRLLLNVFLLQVRSDDSAAKHALPRLDAQLLSSFDGCCFAHELVCWKVCNLKQKNNHIYL